MILERKIVIFFVKPASFADILKNITITGFPEKTKEACFYSGFKNYVRFVLLKNIVVITKQYTHHIIHF